MWISQRAWDDQQRLIVSLQSDLRAERDRYAALVQSIYQPGRAAVETPAYSPTPESRAQSQFERETIERGIVQLQQLAQAEGVTLSRAEAEAEVLATLRQAVPTEPL